MKSLEERKQFILEAGCCGGGEMDEAPPTEEPNEMPMTSFQGFLNRRKSKRKKNG